MTANDNRCGSTFREGVNGLLPANDLTESRKIATSFPRLRGGTPRNDFDYFPANEYPAMRSFNSFVLESICPFRVSCLPEASLNLFS